MEIPCADCRGEEPIWIQENVCLNYSFTAVPRLEMSTVLLKTNLADQRCDETFIPITHLSWSDADIITLCTGVLFPFFPSVSSLGL